MLANLTRDGAEWICADVCNQVYEDKDTAERKGQQTGRAVSMLIACHEAADADAFVTWLRHSSYKFDGITDDALRNAITNSLAIMPKTVVKSFPTTLEGTENPDVDSSYEDEDEDEAEDEDEDEDE